MGHAPGTRRRARNSRRRTSESGVRRGKRRCGTKGCICAQSGGRSCDRDALMEPMRMCRGRGVGREARGESGGATRGRERAAAVRSRRRTAVRRAKDGSIHASGTQRVTMEVQGEGYGQGEWEGEAAARTGRALRRRAARGRQVRGRAGAEEARRRWSGRNGPAEGRRRDSSRLAAGKSP